MNHTTNAALQNQAPGATRAMNAFVIWIIAYLGSIAILAGAAALWNFSTQRFVGTNTFLLFVSYGWCLFLMYRIAKPDDRVSRQMRVIQLLCTLFAIGLLLVLTLSGEHKAGPMPGWSWSGCEDDCYSFR